MYLSESQCLCSICAVLLGFTVTLQSHCVPGCPPVSQWLDHSAPVCQLVDICLLPPPSVVMAATTHTHTIATMPLSSPVGLLHPSLVFPPRHQLWTTYAYPAAHLMQPCHIAGQHSTFSEAVALLCCSLGIFHLIEICPMKLGMCPIRLKKTN